MHVRFILLSLVVIMCYLLAQTIIGNNYFYESRYYLVEMLSLMSSMKARRGEMLVHLFDGHGYHIQWHTSHSNSTSKAKTIELKRMFINNYGSVTSMLFHRLVSLYSHQS